MSDKKPKDHKKPKNKPGYEIDELDAMKKILKILGHFDESEQKRILQYVVSKAPVTPKSDTTPDEVPAPDEDEAPLWTDADEQN